MKTFSILRGSQWGDGFYGYRLKFWPISGQRLTPLHCFHQRYFLRLTFFTTNS